jgi:hypothetical protein
MPDFLYPLLLLACPLGMGVLMWLMMRGSRRRTPEDSAPPSQAELDELRKEIRVLQAWQQGRSLNLFKE